MKFRVALYSLIIAIPVLVAIIYGHLANGEAISLKHLFAAMLVIPVFGYLIWFRWDWAEPRGRKIRKDRAERKLREHEAKTSDTSGVIP